MNKTPYPDGAVAAMEELIGNQGGLGGEQADACFFRPGDMAGPGIANSAGLHAILDTRCGQPLA